MPHYHNNKSRNKVREAGFNLMILCITRKKSTPQMSIIFNHPRKWRRYIYTKQIYNLTYILFCVYVTRLLWYVWTDLDDSFFVAIGVPH